MWFVAMQLLKKHLLKERSLETSVVINDTLAAACACSVFASSTREFSLK